MWNTIEYHISIYSANVVKTQYVRLRINDQDQVVRQSIENAIYSYI